MIANWLQRVPLWPIYLAVLLAYPLLVYPENVLFSLNADLYSPPAQGAPAPAPNANIRSLQQNMQRLKLDVAQHVPIHGQPGTGAQFAQIAGRGTN